MLLYQPTSQYLHLRIRIGNQALNFAVLITKVRWGSTSRRLFGSGVDDRGYPWLGFMLDPSFALEPLTFFSYPHGPATLKTCPSINLGSFASGCASGNRQKMAKTWSSWILRVHNARECSQLRCEDVLLMQSSIFIRA